jgi:uncharacterized protein (TIGR00299 family) protein
VDASAGIAGDMLLGALVDAGAPLAEVQAAVDAVLPDTVRLTAQEVRRAGLRATRVLVEVTQPDQPSRTWADIRELVSRADLPAAVAARALEAFRVLAEAESRTHSIASEHVHFHEVGAWDSIADVVGTSAALSLLRVEGVSASPVALGSGRAATAHGELPVPVPAVLELAKGWSVVAGGDGELATPTGMALLRSLAAACEPLPALEVEGVGVGAGGKDTPGRANVVRVVVGTAVPARTTVEDGPAEPAVLEALVVLEANVDDLDPRVWPEVLASLMASGAADAWLTPILMKKGRPAHTLSVLCRPDDRQRLRDVVLASTSTFGVREYPLSRVALQRDWRTVTVHGHPARVKVSLAADGTVRHATPEFEDAAAVARETGVPVRQVLDDVAAASRAAGIVAGEALP